MSKVPGAREEGRIRWIRPGSAWPTIAIVLSGAIVLAGLAFLRVQPPTTGAKPTPTPPPSEAASPSPASTIQPTAVPETEPPQIVVRGEVPGPDATIPPGNPVIQGLNVTRLASAMVALGLDCQSSAGGEPGWPGGYSLHCEGIDPSGRAKYTLNASYWTFDGVVIANLTVLPSPLDGSIDDPSIGPRVIGPLARMAGNGDAARAWAIAKAADAACGGGMGCQGTFGGAIFTATVGVSGASALTISSVP